MQLALGRDADKMRENREMTPSKSALFDVHIKEL
jgi:hypothetical protein